MRHQAIVFDGGAQQHLTRLANVPLPQIIGKIAGIQRSKLSGNYGSDIFEPRNGRKQLAGDLRMRFIQTIFLFVQRLTGLNLEEHFFRQRNAAYLRYERCQPPFPPRRQSERRRQFDRIALQARRAARGRRTYHPEDLDEHFYRAA